MSTLYTAVVARVPSQTLVTLTQQQSTSSTTLDATKLQTACDDIEARWEIYAGEVFAGTNRKHLMLGVEGVLALLRTWNPIQAEGAQDALSKWEQRVVDYSQTSARDHRSVYTTSELTPSDEVDGSAEVRPWADDDAFDGLVPGQP